MAHISISHVSHKHTLRFVEDMDGGSPEGKANADGGSSRGGGGSAVSSSSRDSLYRHFDKLTKDEQVHVMPHVMISCVLLIMCWCQCGCVRVCVRMYIQIYICV